MRNFFKSVLAVFLAVTMTFGTVAVGFPVFTEIASAQTDEFYELTINTKCFYTDENGELVETQTVLPGENVKFRVYVGTNYISTDSSFMFFFDPYVFTDYNSYDTEFNLNVNPIYVGTTMGSVISEATAVKIDSQNARLQYMVSEGYIDADYVDTHDAYAVNLMLERTPGYIQYDADEWLFEFDMVATGNVNETGSLEVHPGAICTPATPRGFIDVPVVTDIGDPLASSVGMYLVEVTAYLEFENITVTDMVPVTFNANGGVFDDGSEEKVLEIPYNEGFTSYVEPPTKDGYVFDGWFDESGEYVNGIFSRSGMEVYAGWVGIDYNLILDANGGEFYDGNTHLEHVIPYNEPIYDIINETLPTKIGCVFTGWMNSETGEVYSEQLNFMPGCDLYLEAVWANIIYSAEWYVEGEPVAVQEYIYGERIQPPVPEKEGYVFYGWTQEEGSDITVDIENMTMPACDISLYAVFAPCDDTQYIVETYMMNADGEYEPTDTVVCIGMTDYEVEYIPPEMEGFELNEENSILSGTLVGDGTLVLRVFYDRNKYVVTFDDTYETISDEYYYGAEITEPEIPEKVGFVFEDWIDSDGNPVQFPYMMPAEDVTFTAVFSICDYTVYYDLDGGCFPNGECERIEIHCFGEEVNPEYPEKKGYTFECWINAETGEEVSIPLIMPDCDMTLRAVWVTNYYKIYFDDGNGNEIAVYSEEYGSDISETVYGTEIPEKYGYSFEGWINENTGEFFEEGMTMPACELRFVAVWNVNEYKATWVSDDIIIYESVFEFNTVVDFPEAPEKIGYTFAGWADAEGHLYNSGSDYMMPAEDISFNAYYTPDTDTPYRIEIYEMASDGCYQTEPSYFQVVNAETDCVVTVPENAYAKEGFSLDYEISVLYATVMPDGSTVLEVYLARNIYELSFDTGDSIETVNYYYGSTVAEPMYPDKEGCYFNGWLDENGVYVRFPFTMPAENMSLRAEWVTAEFTITFDAGDGYFYDGNSQICRKYLYDDMIMLPEEPEREGYTFMGWSTDGGFETTDIPEYMPAHDICLVALWMANDYCIRWIGDGITFEETVYRYGDCVTVPPNPAKEGYTFSRWYNEDTGDSYIPETMPAYDVTLVAEWKINEYDVEWLNEGEVYKFDTYEYGTEISLPGEPDKEGYVFMGWNDSDGNFVEFPFTVTDNTSFTAVWEPIEFTVIFDANGTEFSDGITEITQTLCYGEVITIPETPCREGYYFAGWSTEPNSPYLVNVPDTMPAHDLVLFAVWELAEYTIRFDDGYGNNFLILTLNYGDDLSFVEYISCPNPENRKFLGWRDADSNEAFTLPATMPDRDVTLVAEWDYSEYTITFDYNGGYDYNGNPMCATTAYSGDMVDVESPVREGYTFIGWEDEYGHIEMPYIITDRDVVITAMWEANIYWVIVDDGFGSHEIIGEYRYGEEIVLPLYDREGYTFCGWYNEYTGEFFGGSTTMPACDLELTALWNVNQYTVRWFAEGVSDEEIVYEYGQDIIIPENPVKEGYVFAGWTPYVPQTMPANNMEFTAVWEALGSVTYTVETYTMNTSGEYNLSTTYHTAEQSGEVSVSPVITEGFELNSDLSVLEGYAYPENELVLKIYIDRQLFAFTTIIDGKPYTTEYLYGSIIADPVAPVKDGYIFTGWDSEIPNTMPANDVTITANFEVAEPEDVYNLGEETYSFRNFVDSDSSGHCFGMSSTSAGYHIGELVIEEIGGSDESDLYTLSRTAAVQVPICKYQAIQGSYSLYSTVAGGRYYKTKKYNISSDWDAVVNYVKNHEYDNKGTLQIGYRKDGKGGHAVNFLRYEEVDGQARIYAYDNNFPTKETYFYMDEDGCVYQTPSSTFKGSIDCIALRSIPEYFNLADDFDTTRCIYADRDTIVVSGASEYSIDGHIDGTDVELCEKVVFEIPAGVEQVTITSLVDNASFMYMGDEYGFGKVDDNNVGILYLASSEDDDTNDSSAFEFTNETANISIFTPSETNINYGDRIVLHADISNIPEGGYVKWSASNGNFSYSVFPNGASCVITPSSSGDTTFTATICDENGTVVSSDSQTMTAKAGFFDKIIAFFKKLFGSTKIIMQNTDK